MLCAEVENRTCYHYFYWIPPTRVRSRRTEAAVTRAEPVVVNVTRVPVDLVFNYRPSWARRDRTLKRLSAPALIGSSTVIYNLYQIRPETFRLHALHYVCAVNDIQRKRNGTRVPGIRSHENRARATRLNARSWSPLCAAGVQQQYSILRCSSIRIYSNVRNRQWPWSIYNRRTMLTRRFLFFFFVLPFEHNFEHTVYARYCCSVPPSYPMRDRGGAWRSNSSRDQCCLDRNNNRLLFYSQRTVKLYPIRLSLTNNCLLFICLGIIFVFPCTVFN
jgi:hypothetical protein